MLVLLPVRTNSTADAAACLILFVALSRNEEVVLIILVVSSFELAWRTTDAAFWILFAALSRKDDAAFIIVRFCFLLQKMHERIFLLPAGIQCIRDLTGVGVHTPGTPVNRGPR